MTEVTSDDLYIYRCVHCKAATIFTVGNPQADCKCGEEFYPVSRRVILGEPMTLREIGGEALGNLDADRVPKKANWTVKGNSSNSSDEYLWIVSAVEELIRHSAHDLIAGDAHNVARLIVSRLAHTHGMVPTQIDGNHD